MTSAQNTHLAEAPPNPRETVWETHMIISDIGGQDLSEADERIVALSLTGSATTHIETAVVDYLSENGFIQVTATVEAEDMVAGLDIFSHDLIEAVSIAGRDPQDLQLVGVHMASEEQIIADFIESPEGFLAITEGYGVDVERDPLPVARIDEFGGQMTTTALEVFCRARDDVASHL